MQDTPRPKLMYVTSFPDGRWFLSGWVGASSGAGDTLEVEEPEGG